MPIDARGKATLGLGIGVLIAAGLSGAWETLALQSPGTSFYIGMLPGPIGALRELATTIGLLLLVAALWMPAAGRVSRALVACLYLGSALSLGAQLYGALHGMFGTQIVDMRADALPLFIARQSGLVLLGAALLVLGRRVLSASAVDHREHNPPS